MAYTLPDFSKWNSTLQSEEPPKMFCKDCKDNTWCVHAPWVSGCNSGTEKTIFKEVK